MSLSPTQEAAAHRTGQDVCVVAGPGSGKTRVLIERFRWLVLERGVAPDRILAITFTEKAATEIKERLVKSFAAQPAVRERIERAWVSTIHAFCARLLRENAIAAGIDPAFTVLDESQAPPLLADVTDSVLDELYTAEPERMRRFLRSLAVGTFRGSFVPDIAGSLIEIYETLRISGTPASKLLYAPPPVAEPLARLQALASEIAGERVLAKTEKSAEQHDEIREWAREVLTLDRAHMTRDFLAVLARKKKWNPRVFAKESAAQRYEMEIRELTDRVTGTALMHYYSAERDLVALALERIDAEYRARKRAASALDFSDLEEAAIHLLARNDDLRSRVRALFDFILMDELQDTNPLQWRLMHLLRSPGNFFAVGDVNQSIYGFRHAQPDLFKKYRAGLADAGLSVDELRTNYRTRPSVLDVVNRVFKPAGGVEPHVLEAGAEFCDKNDPSVETLVIQAESASDGEEVEARWIARRILDLVGQVPVTQDARPAHFGDIAILTRANQSTGELQRALDEFGVPSIVVGGLTFFETREIRDLKLLLDVLVNPRNEVSLAGLLRSPLVGLTDEDLLRLCAEHGRLSDGIRHAAPPQWRTIAELRKIRNLVSPDLLLRRVLDECDYESGLTERGRGNVEKFLSTLRERYARNPKPLAAIVSDIERAAPEAEAPPAGFGDAVRLMTMHKAKGLEFPIVFLPYLHKARSNDFPVMSYSAQYGLGIKWRHPVTNDGFSDCIREANKTLDSGARDGEEDRLLYVGMTRAQEHLVLSWTATQRLSGKCWASLISNAVPVSDPGVRVFSTAAPPEALDQMRTLETAAAAEVQTAERVSSPALYDSAISVTDVSRYAESPRDYYLDRYLRWEAPPRRVVPFDEDDLEIDNDRLDASELGTQVHALLAEQPVDNPSAEALDLAARFRSSALGRAAAKSRLFGREWDFVMAHGDVVVRGQIDLWFQSGKELVIVDYKTDNRRPPISDEDVRGYALQLQIYAEALERALGLRPTRGVLHFLRPDVLIDIDVSPLARSAALERIHELRDAQHALAFD